jgi:hypothetical protein
MWTLSKALSALHFNSFIFVYFIVYSKKLGFAEAPPQASERRKENENTKATAISSGDFYLSYR